MAAASEAGRVGRALVERMGELTQARHGALALANAERNLQCRDRGYSLAALRERPIGAGIDALVVAAGPSIHRQAPLSQLRESGFRGAVVATDSGFGYCLRHGVVPDLVVTVDPHPVRIVRWFGDRNLSSESSAADDYYRRQDLEPSHADELKANRELIELAGRHAAGIPIALATSASEAVVRRVIELGMDVYWWNPMLDDPDRADSATRRLHRSNGFPCVNAGGNVGSAAWTMAHAVLGKRRVGLVGFDFGYYADTPYSRTQYYREAVDLVGEADLDTVFMRVRNPHLDRWFYTDPAYMWYREIFLEMARDADCETYNCTEGGILFGDPVKFVSLKEFLALSTPP
jgi:hypothetical protein